MKDVKPLEILPDVMFAHDVEYMAAVPLDRAERVAFNAGIEFILRRHKKCRASIYLDSSWLEQQADVRRVLEDRQRAAVAEASRLAGEYAQVDAEKYDWGEKLGITAWLVVFPLLGRCESGHKESAVDKS